MGWRHPAGATTPHPSVFFPVAVKAKPYGRPGLRALRGPDGDAAGVWATGPSFDAKALRSGTDIAAFLTFVAIL